MATSSATTFKNNPEKAQAKAEQISQNILDLITSIHLYYSIYGRLGNEIFAMDLERVPEGGRQAKDC
jgi:hypothetical protein